VVTKISLNRILAYVKKILKVPSQLDVSFWRKILKVPFELYLPIQRKKLKELYLSCFPKMIKTLNGPSV
jgi:hypothetical protein